MDPNLPRKNERGKITLNRSMSLKGSAAIGFQGFKIVNSKIKVFKQVEVKNTSIKSKQMTASTSPRKPILQSGISVTQTNNTNTEKRAAVSTIEPSHAEKSKVDTLKEIRERIQAKKKNQEARQQDVESVSLIQNGIHSNPSLTSKTVKPLKYSPIKFSDVTHETKLEKSHNRNSINKKKSGQNITENLSKSYEKDFDEKDHKGDLRWSPNHRDKDSSTSADDKRTISAPNNESHSKKKSGKSYSKSRSGDDDRLRNDGHRKHHDRHNESHRKPKRDYDEWNNYEKISNSGVESSSSRYDKKYNHDGYREMRDYEKDHSKSHHKYSDSRKRNDRSKSPYREKDYRHHGKDRYSSDRTFHPPDRSTSPYRDKDRDVYFANSQTSDRDNVHHGKEYSTTSTHSRSKHQHCTHARKYSASRDDKDGLNAKFEPSHSRKSDTRLETGKNHSRSNSQRVGRSSKSQRRSNDNDTAHQKHFGREVSEHLDVYGRSHDQKIPTLSPSDSKDVRSRSDKKELQTVEKSKKRTKIDEGLFSKLSIAFSLDGEDEDYEVDISESDYDLNKMEGESHGEEENKSKYDSESSRVSAISSNCEQNSDNSKSLYHDHSTGDDAAPMVVVDEVKTDSSECDMFDDQHESINVSTIGINIDCSNNDPNGKCDNTVSKDDEGDVLQGKSFETMSSISCTEGSYDNEPESNSLDKDLSYSLSSPQTPLMDEPQDDVIVINRVSTEQQTARDAVVTTSSTFGHPQIPNADSNTDVSVESSTISSTLDISSSSPIFSVAASKDSENDTTQILRRAGIDTFQKIPNKISENMQLDDICTPSYTLSNSKIQNHVPFSLISNSDTVTTSVISSVAVSSAVTASENVRTERAVSTSTDSQPTQTTSFSVRNKLPDITSRLENVYKSLLNTHFQVIDSQKSTSLNGLIPHEKESVSSHPTVARSPIASALIVNPECLESKDTIDIKINEKKHVEPVSNASIESEVERVLGQAISSVSFCTLQDNSVKLSPRKLKLHATTKTPLPAKKSYIQQVHPHVKVQQKNMEHTSLHHTMNALPSIVTQQPTSEFACDKESHNNNQAQNVKCLSDDLSLARQDSTSSGGNDNDEGPRRSARIRTKKTERSVKKQASVDANQSQTDCTVTAPSTIIKVENIESISDVPKPANRNLFDCSLKELSEEDIFKVKICLTPGLSDCPERFDILEENLYLTSVKKSRARKEIKRMVCDCSLDDSTESEDPCGENCLNRLLMIECSSRCLYGNKCTNKRFQTRNYAPTEVFKTDFKGWGIRAAEDMEPGELVMEYCGEVLDQREFTRRSLEYSKDNHAHFYFMALSQDEVIDATYKGNASRFINHSCDPNAETQKWTVNGRLRVGFFTVKPIKKGDEITFDYQFERYGKIAQKCYCGAEKCRGYLGKAPDENDDGETKFSKLLSSEAFLESDDSIEKIRKKKNSLFQGDMMEKDIGKLKNGLQSTKDVLTLSRLMVRCDTHTQRSMCLQVLKDTTCQTRLKTFLKFHGLSIIWSWMVDITSVDNNEAASLKMDIIDTLCILPISNKNVIEDSKVLPVVERWAKPDFDEKNTENVEKSDEATVEKDTDADNSEAIDAGTTSEPGVDDTSIDNTASQEDASSKVEELTSPNKSPTPDDVETAQNDDISPEKLIEAAGKLLDSWKDLKEIYRIPKRQRPIPSPSQDSSSRTSSPASKHCKTDDYDVKISRSTVNAWRDNSLERWKDLNDRSSEGKFKDIQVSPGSNASSENRREPSRRKRRFSTDSDDGMVPWHCKPPRSLKMSREEHRRRFEQGVEKREQERRRLEEMEAEMTRTVMINNQPTYMMEEIPSLVGPDITMMAPSTTFTPGGVSGNLIQINPAPVMVDQFGQQVDMMQPLMQMSVQQGYNVQQNMQGIYNTDMGVQQSFQSQQGFQEAYSLQATNAQAAVSMIGVNQQQMLGNTFVGHAQNVPIEMQHIAQPPIPTVQQPQQPMNNVTILGTQNGQAIVMLSAEQLQKLTQGDMSSIAPKTENAESTKKTGRSTKDSTSTTMPKQLPPNWKTATDPDGRVYYYHDITRETQWDPPQWKDEEKGQEDKGSPSDDEKQPKDKNKQDKSTEEGRKAKDQFRLKMSQFVVQCLSSFRKPDKKVGRITTTEDFKHLARKLTHSIMEKELRQVQVLEDLDFNANVKYKTKEYVKKYMSKVGPVYRIKDDT